MPKAVESAAWRILVTGGTGSFGRAFVKEALSLGSVERVVVFSRDEMKQHDMEQDDAYKDPRVRFFIGDVRDKGRLLQAMEGANVVIHAAALKQVPAAEYNPFEAIKTNILGAQNVIEAALERGIRQVVALSTDKAAAPINLYGATKLCSDKLFVAANNFRGNKKIAFSVVRYGNVFGSRGSVVPFFLKARKNGVLPITHGDMTRFSITLPQAVDFVLDSLRAMVGGEIFVPKIPSYKILDLAKAVAPGCEHRVVGIRPGEKIDEELITPSDALSCAELENQFIVAPRGGDVEKHVVESALFKSGKSCPSGFTYTSATNDHWLSVEELRDCIKDHIDPDFEAHV
jgi:UDP-N-acetylglucosamine 4,6-dehydratase (inverting)